MAETWLINPPKRRRKKRKRRRKRYKRNPVSLAANPRRRRRTAYKRKRRYRRNPPMVRGVLGQMQKALPMVLWGGAGAILSQTLTKQFLREKDTGYWGIGANLGIGIITGMLVGTFLRRRGIGQKIATGAAIAAGIRLLQEQILPNFPMLGGGVSAYWPESEIGGYYPEMKVPPLIPEFTGAPQGHTLGHRPPAFRSIFN